jgi:hypothetical protein
VKDIETVRDLFRKYDLSAPVKESARNRILRSKRKTLADIFERNGITKKSSFSGLFSTTLFSFNTGGFMKKGLIAAGAFAVIAIIGISFYVTRTPSSESSKQTAAVSNDSAEIVFTIGDVSVSRDAAPFAKLSKGEKIGRNDIIKTGEKASAVLDIKGIGSVRVLEKSEFRFTALARNGSNELLISKGSVYSKITKLEKGTDYKVKTPTCVAAVRGTQFLVTYSEKDPSKVNVLSGKVAVSSSEMLEKEEIAENDQTVEVKGKTLDKRTLSKIEKLVLEKCSIYDDLDQNDKNYNQKFEDLQKKEKAIEEQINKLTAADQINPLDRLRKAGKPLTMLHLRDGSQIAGSVVSANEKTLSLDTGDGVIKVPTAEILRRVMIK